MSNPQPSQPASRQLLDVHVNLFRGSHTPEPIGLSTLGEVLERIRSDHDRRRIKYLRRLLASEKKLAYDQTKRTLDAFTPCGTFAPTRAKDSLEQHSGIIHVDLDHLADVETVKQRLAADPHVVYVFVSPSGAGLKLGVRVEPCHDDAAYKHAWQVVATAHQQTYGLTWDPSGKDVSRLCYLSWDPDLYRNLDAQCFPIPDPVPPAAMPMPIPRPLFTVPADRRERYARQGIETAVAMIDASTPGYRHQARLKAAYLLGGYIAGGLLTDDDAYSALAVAVARNTDDLERSMLTIADGLRHGQAQPITLADLEAQRQAWLDQHSNGHDKPAQAAAPMTRKTVASNGHEAPPPPPQSASAGGNDDIHLTDVGNGLRLVQRFGNDIRYVNLWHKWLAWRDGLWVLDDGSVEWMAKDVIGGLYRSAAEGIAQLGDDLPDDETQKRQHKNELAMLQAVLDWAHRSENGPHIDLMVKRARVNPKVKIAHADLDTNPWLFQVANGTIDLRTGEIRAPRQRDLITKRSTVRYDADATCPRWIASLQRWQGHPQLTEVLDAHERDRRIRDSDVMITYLKRLVGMSLTADVSAQILMFLHGGGNNGKSTFLNTIRALAGDYGLQAAPNFLLVKQYEGHPTELADLFGKRFVSTIEVEKGKHFAETLIKVLTGGEPVRARRMREDAWEFPATWKIWLAANDKPPVKGRDKAMWRRIKLIPFDVTIPDHEVDHDLVPTLLEELPGILNWAIEGCLEWQARGLEEPEKVTRATENYRKETDILAQFCQECCTLKRELKTQSALLHKAFDAYTGQLVSPVEFAEIMTTSGFTKKTIEGRVYWFGIGLTSDTDEGHSR